MTLRETTIAKLQQLPEPFLQQISDFIDFLIYRRKPNSANDKLESAIVEAWEKWFESVNHLESLSKEPTSDYQQLLLLKYQQQGLEL